MLKQFSFATLAATLLLAASCAAPELQEGLDIDDWLGDYRIAQANGDCPLQVNILTGAARADRPGARGLLARHYRDGDCVPRDLAAADRLERGSLTPR